MTSKIKEKAEFVEKHTAWLVDFHKDTELAADVRVNPTLDGIYDGKSQKIHRMIRLAYLRGVQRGAGIVWNAKQGISLRNDDGPRTT